VVAAARLLFNATSVPQNIRQLDLLDELEYVSQFSYESVLFPPLS